MSVYFSFKETLSAFMVLFAVIDILGAIPIIVSLREKNQKIEAGKAAIISFIILVAFLFVGKVMLSLFNVDISSFAVAGAVVLLVLAVEMIFGIEIFKNDSPCGSATIVPLVFPLIAGAASFTTLLSLRAEYNILNIIVAVAMNMGIVYVVLRKVYYVERIFGKSGVYVMRKFFGIILLAIAVRLFTGNLTSLIGSFGIEKLEVIEKVDETGRIDEPKDQPKQETAHTSEIHETESFEAVDPVESQGDVR